MKNILFVHDGHVFKDYNENYYGLHLNNTLVERYMYFGTNITFIMRVKHIDKNELFRYSKFTNNNFACIELPNYKSITKYYSRIKEAKKIIQSAVERADMIIVRMPSIAGAIAITHARKLNKLYLVEMVACTFDAYWNYNWKGKLIAHYKYYRTRQIIRNCTHVLYVTKYFLQKRYPNSGVHIGISDVELSVQPSNVLKGRIEHIRSRDSKKPLILGTVAAIDVPYKGHKDVIMAVAELKRRGFIVLYHIVGQGNSDRLKSIIIKQGLEKEVKIIGALKHNEVFDFMKTLDVYIQPSKQEGLPRAILEAMSVALPVMGSKVGGIPELLDSSQLFMPGDVRQISDNLLALTPELLIQQATHNYYTSLEYGPQILEQRRTEFYHKILINASNA